MRERERRVGRVRGGGDGGKGMKGSGRQGGRAGGDEGKRKRAEYDLKKRDAERKHEK